MNSIIACTIIEIISRKTFITKDILEFSCTPLRRRKARTHFFKLTQVPPHQPLKFSNQQRELTIS